MKPVTPKQRGATTTNEAKKTLAYLCLIGAGTILMVAGIPEGIGALKAAYDIAKTLKDINDRVALNTAVIDLQSQILTAQDAALGARDKETTLLERISELEKEVARFDAWEREKERYQLHKLPPGILIYRLKPGMENGEPFHEICADCFQKGEKSLLHCLGQGNGLTHWKCYGCGFDERSGTFAPPRVVHSRDDWLA